MIRFLTREDIKSVYQILKNSIVNERIDFQSISLFSPDISVQSVEKYLTNLDPLEGQCAMGYFEKEKLIGFLGLSRSDRSSVYHKRDLRNFYIEPEYRNKGIGKKLLTEAIKNFSNKSSCRYLRAGVSSNWIGVLKICENMGFYRYANEPEGIFDGKNTAERIFLRLDLTKTGEIA